MYVYRWRQTKFGPLADGLQGRFGERCRIVVRAGRGPRERRRSHLVNGPAQDVHSSSILIEFEDGARFVCPRYSVRSLEGAEPEWVKWGEPPPPAKSENRNHPETYVPAPAPEEPIQTEARQLTLTL